MRGGKLNLLYITREPAVAEVLQHCGVDWVFVDLETLGKAERQAGRNTVKSDHTVEDVRTVRAVLGRAQLLVRINPWGAHSQTEIDAVVAAGADIVMLPFFTTAAEVRAFVEAIDGRARCCLLLETPEACAVLDDVLAVPGIDHVHIGLNDLHMALGQRFMFEPLVDGTVDRIAEACHRHGVPFGFGGCARIGSLVPPAEDILAEHYRLGSSSVILSRSFCNLQAMENLEVVEASICSGVAEIRAWEAELRKKDEAFFEQNRESVRRDVLAVAAKMR